MTEGRPVRDWWFGTDRVLLLALLAVFVWLVGDVLLLVFAGILLAVALDGLARCVTWLVGLPRSWALTVAGVLLLAFLGLTGWAIVPQFLSQLDELWQRLLTLVDEFQEMLNQHDWAQRLLNDTQEEVPLAETAGTVMQHAASAGLALIGLAGSLVVLIAIAIFAAADPDLYRRGLLVLLPQRHRPPVSSAFAKTGRALRWWFFGQLISMLALGLSVSLGLMIIGVDLWLSLGVLTALLTFIPFLGPIIAGVPIVAVGFAAGWETGLIVLTFYLVVQNLEGNFLVPMIQHRVVNLAPALLISIQILMGTLFGAMGLIMAAPLTVVGMVFVQELYLEGSDGEA